MAKIVVERKPVNENPFYGLRNNLLLFQNGGKGNVTISMLNEAWKEALNDKVKREMFFTLLFSIGDITAREHNAFRGNKVDAGGNAQRMAFRIILSWMKQYANEQYWKFVFSRMVNEYTNFDNLFGFRVQTVKKTKKLSGTIASTLDLEELRKLAQYAANVILHGSDDDKRLIAKYITRPRTSKRQKHKELLPATKTVMALRTALLLKLSELCNFEVVTHPNFTEFKGYYEWRKPFIHGGVTALESAAFSSKSVLLLDEQGFYAWLEAMPASARYRVRTRLLAKDNTIKPKWGDLGQWYLNWEKFKETKQSEVRVLEEKVRQKKGTVRSLSLTETEADPELEELETQLAQTQKEAKVTVGAVNFGQMFHEIVLGTIDEIKVQPFLDKVVLPYNSLTFIDDSASMQTGWGSQVEINGANISAFDFACFIAAITLMKNPTDTGRSLLGFFSNETRLLSSIDAYKKPLNKLINVPTTVVSLPLYDANMHFLTNLANIRALAHAMRTGNGTYISTIPDFLHRWTQGDSAKIEQLMEFPVWTIITDGNWNNLHSPEHSMNDFMTKCDRYFGFKPYVVAIDVSANSVPADRFQGIENMMVVPPNPVAIQQFLMNFKDMDIVDVYLPLLSLYRSNRYDLIRQNTL